MSQHPDQGYRMPTEIAADALLVRQTRGEITRHSSQAFPAKVNGISGIQCGCGDFIPLSEAPKVGVDDAYSQHLAESLYLRGLLSDG